MGTYWDAAAAEKSDKAAEAVESYLKLEAIIEAGKPGYGEFDEFTLYDNWVILLKDFEQYWTEHPSVGFKIGDIKKGDIDRSTRTASYAVRVWWGYSTKAYNMRYSLQTGLKKVRQRDWTGVSYYWPFVSIYADAAKADEKFLRNGVALIAAPYDWGLGRMNLYEHVSPAAFSVHDPNYDGDNIAGRFLYEYKLALVDESGKTLATSTYLDRHDDSWDDNGGYYDDVTFASVKQDAMKVIDAGKAKVIITELSLKYGNPYYNADGNQWVTERSKLPSITYNVAQVLMEADDIDEIYGSVYLKNKKAAAEAKAKADAEAAAKRKSTRFLSTTEVKTILGISQVITKEMFAEYENLESIGIPLGVHKIDLDAFVNCKKLKKVYFAGTKKDWKNIAIDKTGNETLLKAKMTFKTTYSGEGK